MAYLFEVVVLEEENMKGKRMLNKDVATTLIFIFGALLVIIFILGSMGVLDKSEEEIRSVAEFVCWQHGYMNGADSVVKDKIRKDAYIFTCKEGTFDINFSSGRGIIIGTLD
jgi:hypothetical protein